jgi:hypothetical protein
MNVMRDEAEIVLYGSYSSPVRDKVQPCALKPEAIVITES